MSIRRSTSASLDSRLNTLPGLPGVAWPNQSYDPAQGELFLRVNNLMGAGSLIDLQHGQETVGIYQVDVVAPIGKGPAEAENMADDIIGHFATVPSRKTGSVYIEAISSSPARVEQGSWYVISISINYRVIH